MSQTGSAVAPFTPAASIDEPKNVSVSAQVAGLQEEIQQLADLKTRLESRLLQLESANSKLAQDEFDQRQRLETAQAFIHALLGSSFWKITGPIRYLRHLLKPRGCTAQHLLPVQHLEAAAGECKATGFDPQFIARCWMPAGWVRFRVHLVSPERTVFDLFADHGEGFTALTCVERIEYVGELQTEFFVRFERPIFALRLDPCDQQGTVRLEAFEACPIPIERLRYQRLRQTLTRLKEARRAGRSLKQLWSDLRAGALTPPLPGPRKHSSEIVREEDYHRWFESQRLDEIERAQRRDEAAGWFATPLLFSVIVPVYEVPDEYLRAAIESVRRQIYPDWELCLAFDGAKSPGLRHLLEEYEQLDDRIHVVYLETNVGVSAASNAALELARGDFVALLDHDDELADDALWQMARSLASDPAVDMLYSDEDKLTLEGKHVQPYFKPGWSPELLLSYMYTCHLGVYRTALVRQLGGFRSEFDQAQDYDLALRVARNGRVRHVPGVLYHWRMLPTSTATSGDAKPRAHEAARRALEAHLAESKQAARVEGGALQGLFRVRFAIPDQPLVSIIIPTASGRGTIRNCSTYLLANCLTALRRGSTYPNIEILIIDNGDMPEDLKREIALFDVRTLSFTGPFNLSAKLNFGAAHAHGTHLVFLNDDTEIITPDWLEAMLEYSQQSDIGSVGVKLYFGDDHLQHVGVQMQDGLPVHLYHRHLRDNPGYFGSNLVVRNCAAVTGACFMTRRDVFQEAGGFDEAFVLTHSDIDYCLKVRAAGKRIVFTPHAELYHFESLSRSAAPAWEATLFQERWQGSWASDEYSNPHLTLVHLEPSLNRHCWLSETRARQFDREGTPVTARNLDRAGVRLWEPSIADVNLSESGAARWVLALLLNDPALRSRFSKPLSGGPASEFADWLRGEYARQPAATLRASAHLEAIFRNTPGEVVRQIYDYSIEVRQNHPLAQTPGGRWRYLRWLLELGMSRERLSIEQVLWFVLEADEDPGAGLVRAYRMNPDWQKRFPLALTCFGRSEFLRAIGREDELEDAAWFRDLELPATMSACDELRLLLANRADLRVKHPDALTDDQRLAELVASLPEVDEAWRSRLEAEVAGAALGEGELGANLFGHFCFASGLNVALRSTESSLQRAGVVLARRDVPCGPRQNLPGRDAYLDLEAHDITLLHVAPQPILDHFYPLSGLYQKPGIARVAVWYWELESAPLAWKTYARLLEEIWAPTRFIARALEPIMPGSVVWMPPGVELEAFLPRQRSHFQLSDDEFLFLNLFDMTSGLERKNPFAIIAAFQQAFRAEEPARLVLKVSRATFNRARWQELQHAARAAGRITLIDSVLSRSDTLALMNCADAYVSLHRSEGFGLPLAEAMLLGKPVVATGYSGNMDFMTPENSFLVDYEVTAITDDLPNYERGMTWAEPSIEHAARQMRAIYDEREQARGVGERARVEVRKLLDPRAAGERMLERLKVIRERKRQRSD
jgi:GT2 family glycosyltransferase/glycosyltransferase involved in cell wall biosynthesis